MTADDWFGSAAGKPPKPPSPTNRMLMWVCTTTSAVDFALGVTQASPMYFIGAVGFAALSYVYWARN